MRAISAAGSGWSGCMAPKQMMRSSWLRAAQSLMPATLSGRVATGWTTARATPLRSMLARRPASVPS